MKVCHRSAAEDEIFEYISQSLDKTIIRNDRSVLDGLELDMYIPSMKLAIEYNGCYWHSEEYTSKEYHKHKTDICESKGVNLLHIFEWDWINNKQLVQRRIKRLLNDVVMEDCYVVTSADAVKMYKDDDEIASLIVGNDGAVAYTNFSDYKDNDVLATLVQHVFNKPLTIKLDRSCTDVSSLSISNLVVLEDTQPQPYYIKRRRLVADNDDYEYVVYGVG